jgi:hypothetical protein
LNDGDKGKSDSIYARKDKLGIFCTPCFGQKMMVYSAEKSGIKMWTPQQFLLSKSTRLRVWN